MHAVADPGLPREKFFAENCIKMKEFGPRGGGGHAPLDPPNAHLFSFNWFWPTPNPSSPLAFSRRGWARSSTLDMCKHACANEDNTTTIVAMALNVKRFRRVEFRHIDTWRIISSPPPPPRPFRTLPTSPSCVSLFARLKGHHGRG